MLGQATVDMLRDIEDGEIPILSVYLGLKPNIDELRSVPARLKDLLADVREQAGALDREAEMSLRADVDAVIAMTDRIGRDLGRGVAIFRSTKRDFDEYVSLPAPVRDRAVVARHPYLRPLDAMLEHYKHDCAVVIDRRKASIFRFYMGELESWEEMAEEAVRKANYGGFSGYEEHRVRNRADEIANRHYRDTADRLRALLGSEGFDLLLIGGPAEHVDGLRSVLPPDVVSRLAGTFTVDPGTMTPAIVREHCERLTDEHESREQRRLVDELFETAGSGGAAAIGLAPVVAAANQRAVGLLAVQADEAAPGFACGGCGWISLDAGGSCQACGGELREVPDVVDALVAAVRRHGSTVEHVFTESPLSEHLVAAKLRFPVAAAV